MRFLQWLLILLALYGTAEAASIDKDIITGAFSTPSQAHFRNSKVEAYLGHDPAVAAILKEKRFYFDVKYANGNYRSVMTHFIDQTDMLTVLQSVKRIFPDAYAIASTASVVPPTKPKAEKSVPVPAPKTAAVPQPKPKPAPKPQAAPEAKPLPAAVHSSPAKAPAKKETVNEIEDEIVIIDEAKDEAPATSQTQSTEQPAVPTAQDEIITETITPDEPSSDRPSYLIPGIIAAAVILGLLFFFARRKKSQNRALKMPEMINFETEPAEATRPTEPPVAVVEEEPASEPEPVAFEPEAPAAAPVETVEEPVVKAEIQPETHAPLSPRKKRDLPAHMEGITKERLSDFAGSRILIAEDNLINQKVITKLLEGSGIEIVMADNGQIAIDTLSSDPNFNMILMDAHMPVKDGFEASREIRRNILFEPIVIVALSGDVSSDDIRKMREAGMEEQLAKPLRIEALYNVMYQYLDFAAPEEEETAFQDELSAHKHHTDTPLNSAEGLEICGGDKEMYAEILDEFVETYRDSDKQIEAYLAANDEGKVVALALDIKGVAANIGADPLSEAAETLREAILINQIDAYEKLAIDFRTELHKVLSAIETFKSTL